MNRKLKQEIKNEIKKIIFEIEYEEYKFNKMFHSNMQFQKSYFKFEKIYIKYGKEAYLKYVPFKYKKQELKNLIQEQNFLQLYEHYGTNTLHKLKYTAQILNTQIQTQNKFKLFIIKIKKLLSSKFIFLPTQTILALPANIPDFESHID